MNKIYYTLEVKDFEYKGELGWRVTKTFVPADYESSDEMFDEIDSFWGDVNPMVDARVLKTEVILER